MDNKVFEDIARIVLCYALPSLIMIVIGMGIYGSIVINRAKVKNKNTQNEKLP